jgi:lysophospholipase L1-like esterase
MPRFVVIAAALSLTLGVSACGGGQSRPSAVAHHRLSVSVSGSGTISGSGIDCTTNCSQSYPRSATALVGFGHSVVAGYGSSDPSTSSFMALLAADLGATDKDYGVDGAIAAFPEGGGTGDGGWAHVLSIDNPGTNLAAAPSQVTTAVMFGFNDLTNLGGPNHLGPFKQAMITILSRVDSLAVFEANSPSVSVPSGWTGAPSKNVGSGTTLVAPHSTGDPITITVPSSFQGGTIALGFTASAGSATPTGQAVYGVQVNGGPTIPYTIDGPSMVTPLIGGSGGWIGTVDRLTGLAPGAHKITVALESTSGTITTYFNYWQAEAPLAKARPIVVPLQYDITHGALELFAEAPYTPVPAGIAALNRLIKQAAAGFPANVQTVRLDLGTKTANFYTDLAHPSDAGYTLIARQLLAALRTVTLHATPSDGSRFAGWKGGGCSGTGRCTVRLDADQSVTATFTGGSAGRHRH